MQNHIKVIFFPWFWTLIFRFRSGYPLSKLYFSERTPRVLSEAVITSMQRVPRAKENICCQSLEEMLDYWLIICHNKSYPGLWTKLNCRMYSLYLIKLRSKTKIMACFLWNNFKIVRILDFWYSTSVNVYIKYVQSWLVLIDS